jgi:hypothetical protein
MPARIEQCFGTLTKIPVKNMSGAELTKLVVKLRHSEVQKSRCGRDVVTWYSGVRKDWGPPWVSPLEASADRRTIK